MPGVAVQDQQLLCNLRRIVLEGFNGSGLQDTPQVALLAVMGYTYDPVCSAFFNILAEGVRYHCRIPRWLETVPLDFATAPWPQLVPGAQMVLDRLGWWTAQRGDFICRRTAEGSELRFQLGVDNLNVLQEWVIDFFRVEDLQKCGRVTRDLHRAEHAPNITGQVRCYFEGHKAIYDTDNRKQFRQAALATGCSCWYYFPKLQLDLDDLRATCMCGALLPSRPHLMWVCPDTCSARSGVDPPTNRAEERLLACLFEEMPSCPTVFDPGGIVEELAQEFVPVSHLKQLFLWPLMDRKKILYLPTLFIFPVQTFLVRWDCNVQSKALLELNWKV